MGKVCPNSPDSRLSVGMIAQVTPGDPNNVRNLPAGRKLFQIPAGQTFRIIGGPQCDSVNGLTWWQVEYQGQAGWTPEGKGDIYWLQPLDSGISDSNGSGTNNSSGGPTQVNSPSAAKNSGLAAIQSFQGGYMIWIQQVGQVWALYNGSDLENGHWFSYPDTFHEGEPETDTTIVPPVGLYQPRRGFGKVWRQATEVRRALGWALSPEMGYTTTWTFDGNRYTLVGPSGEQFVLIYSPTGDASQTWSRSAG